MSKFGWDLPPGVSANMIPGNRPEDEAWEKLEEEFYASLDTVDMEIVDTTAGIGDIVTQALTYGIELGKEQQRRIEEENKFYEERGKE